MRASGKTGQALSSPPPEPLGIAYEFRTRSLNALAIGESGEKTASKYPINVLQTMRSLVTRGGRHTEMEKQRSQAETLDVEYLFTKNTDLSSTTKRVARQNRTATPRLKAELLSGILVVLLGGGRSHPIELSDLHVERLGVGVGAIGQDADAAASPSNSDQSLEVRSVCRRERRGRR